LALLDRGREIIFVYPETVTYSNRGDLKLAPADEPVRIRCTTERDRSQMADLPGQIDVQILKVTARNIPLGVDGRPGTWARIVYHGQEYDLGEPPRHNIGASRATDHWVFTIRSRSNMSMVSTEQVRQETREGPDQYGPIGREEFY
jgi:hypothetical protein